MMMSQSEILRGTTLKKRPPTVTMRICPRRMESAIIRKLPQSLKWKAERPVSKARALNIFQNWRNTKVVKKRLSS